MKRSAIILVLLVSALNANCQDSTLPDGSVVATRFNIGFGAGLDYGGFGAKLNFLISEKFELFGGLGYNILGLGFNAGADFRLAPNSRYCPYIGAMYGYNAVIKVIGAEYYNQTYYGPSFNLGLEMWSGRNPNFLNIELLLPIRSTEYQNDIQSLKDNPAITFSNEPLPVAFSIGYHISF